jgi:hypothetical protein
MPESKTSKKILMCFSIGKQSQPKFKIISNKTLFSYSAYKQSKPKKIKKVLVLSIVVLLLL